MPSQQDNAWPTGLLAIFDRARAEHAPFENRYYGPYDKLLNYCFGDTFKFYIAPQTPPRDDSRDGVDFIVFLVVFDANDQPVLFAEVKDDSWAHNAELRYRADKQMRDRYALVLDECPPPPLGPQPARYIHARLLRPYDVIRCNTPGRSAPRAIDARSLAKLPRTRVAVGYFVG